MVVRTRGISRGADSRAQRLAAGVGRDDGLIGLDGGRRASLEGCTLPHGSSVRGGLKADRQAAGEGAGVAGGVVDVGNTGGGLAGET